MDFIKINYIDILKQIKYDLNGKDSQRGITLSYGWLANQFGHFSLGFIPAFIFYFFRVHKHCSYNSAMWAAFSTIGFWTLFELCNFLIPLLTQSKKGSFEPAWYNVGFDTITDLLFFYCGSFSLIIFYTQEPWVRAIVILLWILPYFLFNYWYRIKMYIQYAYYPFQRRLSQWKNDISAEDKALILKFIAKEEVKHVLIFGGDNSGKTGLAIAMATELSIKQNACFYTTAMKFTQFLDCPDKTFAEDFLIPWSWRQTECLVIDDVNAGSKTPEFVSTSILSKALQESLFVDENIKALKNKSVIWVIGKRELETDWINFLVSLGLHEKNIVPIELK